MKRKTMLTVIVMVLCLAPLARGQHIVMISGHDTRDLGWVDLLEAQGYTVERVTDKYEDTVSAENWTALGSADLIIMSRSVGNGSNHDDDLVSWNGLTTPIINMCARACGNDRWDWLNTGTSENSDHSSNMAVIEPTDTIFAGVDLPEGNSINVLSHDDCKFLQISDAGNGELLARRDANNDYVWIVRWAAGVPFYTGSASPVDARMLFVAGEEVDNGEINLNAAGRTIFLNAVYELSGATFNRPPVVDAGKNQVVRLEGASVEVPLDASVVDVDTGSLTYSWSGDGVSFRDGIDNVEDVNAIFTSAGEYVLTLEVDDGTTIVSDTVLIAVTGDIENILVAHWELDDGAGTTVSDSAYEHDNIGDIVPTPVDPNWADGWVGTGSYMFYGDRHIEITTDANSVSGDPNTPHLDNIRYGVTMAAWVRIDLDSFVPGSEDDDMNVLFKRDSWYLRYYDDSIRMRVNAVEAADDTLGGSIDIRDGYWHHVAGVYDGQYMVLYVDGVEDTRQEAEGFVQPSAEFAAIGANADASQVWRYWKGNIDDVRVYSYGFTADEIEELANDAPRVPMVNAGANQEYNINPALPLTLEGSVIDGDAVPPTAEWTVAPESPGAAENVDFDNASDPQTTATFTAGGVFVLRLTATDSVDGEVVVISDDVIITAVAPTCQKVVDDGLLLKSDLSGDCYVGLADIAIIAGEWTACNDPENQPVCDWPF